MDGINTHFSPSITSVIKLIISAIMKITKIIHTAKTKNINSGFLKLIADIKEILNIIHNNIIKKILVKCTMPLLKCFCCFICEKDPHLQVTLTGVTGNAAHGLQNLLYYQTAGAHGILIFLLWLSLLGL